MGVTMSVPVHVPVLLKETIELLAVQPGGRYIDCTLGTGGHARTILEKSSPGGQLLGIDADPAAIKIARNQLKDFRDAILLVNDNFVNLQAICIKYDFFPVHGIIFDLGLSSLQLEINGRGFSFQHDAPLDMRFNPSQELTAADIVNNYPETKLAGLIWKYGEETHSRQIAHRIVTERPIKTTFHLVQVIEKAVGGRKGKIHPATKTFQALRIAVNHELENLESALQQAIGLLGFGGRLVVISYHSLEDRIVKQLMRRESVDCICPPGLPACTCGHKASLKLITKKVITPQFSETKLNPRSRSARLRAAERIIAPEEQYETVEKINCSIDDVEAQGWGKPVLLEKLRRTFLALQFDNFNYARNGRFGM